MSIQKTFRVLRWAPVLCALLCSSCIRWNWERHRLGEPIVSEQHAALSAGTTELQACLDQLGAPLLVWEEPNDHVAMAWGWRDDGSWGLNMSVPLAEQFSASIDYGTADLELLGLVLVFDGERRLISKRQGALADLTQSLRRHRSPVVEE